MAPIGELDGENRDAKAGVPIPVAGGAKGDEKMGWVTPGSHELTWMTKPVVLAVVNLQISSSAAVAAPVLIPGQDLLPFVAPLGRLEQISVARGQLAARHNLGGQAETKALGFQPDVLEWVIGAIAGDDLI
ncbi:hypothetical protein GCM10028821_45870 [Hymenobacter jeollabukensis]